MLENEKSMDNEVPDEVYEVPAGEEAKQASLETDKLNRIQTFKKGVKGLKKKGKKGVKGLKTKMGKSKPDSVNDVVVVEEPNVEETNLIKELQETILKLQEDNQDLQSQADQVKLEKEEAQKVIDETPFDFQPDETTDDETTDETPSDSHPDETQTTTSVDQSQRISDLEAEVLRWQAVYLESNEIGSTRIQKLEKDCEDASTAEKTADRVFMLEAQVRESVKVLKSAQMKMIQRHEREFHLQQTVEELNEQVEDANLTVENYKESFAAVTIQFEQEQKAKAELQNELDMERSKAESYKKELSVFQVESEELEKTMADDIQPTGAFCCLNALRAQ